MDNPFNDDISRFSVIFTRAVIAWNNAEESARNILSSLSEGGIGALAAIIHLGNAGMKDALLTLADSMEDDIGPKSEELAGHIRHFVAGMDVLRGYRNFYVHSLQSVGKKPDDEAVFQGSLRQSEAKGRLAWIDHTLTTDELSTFARHARDLSFYGSEIATYVSVPNAFLAPQPKKPLSSIEKPEWPDPVKKNRRYLTGR